MKMISYSGWKFLKFTNFNVFIESILHSTIDLFWNKVMNNLDNTKIIIVILRVEMSDGSYLTLSPILRINKSDKALFIKIISDYVYLISSNIYSLHVTHVIFQYKLLNKDTNKQVNSILNKSISSSSYYFGTYNLPLTTDLSNWGKLTIHGDYLLIKSEKYESDILVTVQGFRQVYNFKLEDRIILTIIDYFGDSHNSFTRVINNNSFIISNGEVVSKSVEFKIRFLSAMYYIKSRINIILESDLLALVIDKIAKVVLIIFYSVAVISYIGAIITLIYLFIHLFIN